MGYNLQIDPSAGIAIYLLGFGLLLSIVWPKQKEGTRKLKSVLAVIASLTSWIGLAYLIIKGLSRDEVQEELDRFESDQKN